LETEDTVAAKRWSNLIVTYDGSRMAEGITVYIDGKPSKFKVYQDTLYRPFRNAGKEFLEPFRIGGGGGAERRFRGRIDDVRVYGRMLNSKEIAAKPAAQRSEIEKLQLRWYYLENGASPEVRDASKRLAALRIEKEKLE